MGWTTPTDRAAGYTVTNTDWNVVEDNLTFLYGDSAWTNVPSFTNSWVAGSPAPGYILIGRIVYLRGAMSGGTANTAAFTLPVGYRPSTLSGFACIINGGAAANVTVTSAGVVTPLTSVNLYLNNVTFPVV